LRTCYNSVLLTYGAEEDRLLGIKGESLKNILPARLVGIRLTSSGIHAKIFHETPRQGFGSALI
jgi:hypothetical protein